MNNTRKPVCGVGINDASFTISVKGQALPTYKVWHSLLVRCYSPKCHSRQPTYKGCSVSENFKYYSFFHEWSQNQIGFGLKGFHLDKDLLVKGNRIYSEDTCVFIPSAINSLLTSNKASRGKYPIGVNAYRKKVGFTYISSFRVKDKLILLGRYSTPEEAFYAYKQAKEAHIKTLAEEYKHLIDPRAYQALLNYRVEITD